MPIDFEQWHCNLTNDYTDTKSIARAAWDAAHADFMEQLVGMLATIDSIQLILAGAPLSVQGHRDAIEALTKYKEMLKDLEHVYRNLDW